MTQKTPAKARARKLQKETGWPYTYCLKTVAEFPDDRELAAFVFARAQPKLKEADRG